MGAVHFSYAPSLPLIVQLENHKSNLNYNNTSRLMIMSYREFLQVINVKIPCHAICRV